MKNHTIKSMTIALGVVLSTGLSTRADTYTENFSTGNTVDPATNYGFTQMSGGSSHVRFGMDIDPLGLALSGAGDWVQWNYVGIESGIVAQPGEVVVFSCDAAACPPADGEDGNGATSHWGRFYASANDVVGPPLGGLYVGGIKWEVTDENTNAVRHGWVFEPGHVTGGSEQHYIDGYLGTYDEIDGKQELVVRLEIWVDRIDNVVWGTIDDGVTKTTTPKYPMRENHAIKAIQTGGLTANTGWQTAEGIDVDNLSACVVSPVASSPVVAGNVAGFEFHSSLGQTYRLQYSSPGNSNVWADTGAVLIGDGNLMTFYDSTASSTTRNFRVLWAM